MWARVAAALIAAFLLQSLLASRIKSPAFDEPAHIAAGLAYVETGVVRANLQHPPLVKELAGLSLWLAGVRLPRTEEARDMAAGKGGETAVGNATIAQYGPDRVLFWARLPLILLSGALGVALFLWGRRLAGDVAATAAVFLWALDPTFLAHSFLVTMDAGLAVFTVLFVFALWSYANQPSARRVVLCALALGAALTTKFSALTLLVLLPLAVLQKGDRRILKIASAPFLVLMAAMVLIQLAYLTPDGVYLYGTGIGRVNADHDPSYQVFLGGELAHHFTSYFAWAFALKTPLPILILAALGVTRLPRGTRLYLLLPPAALFVVHTLWADNLGVRYLLPMLPFVYLIAGIGAAWLIARARPAAAALGLWLVIAAVGIYPDHLAYFNEGACLPGNIRQIGLAGGTRCGIDWFDESNVDWGQGLKQVKEWVDRNAPGHTVRLAYFGTTPPETYGLKAEPAQLSGQPAPGLYVVSAHWVARSRAAWLRETPPAAIIGHSWYVYRLN
jgi:hypothetical protein